MTDIRLRKLEPSDLPFLYQWENDASCWADGDNHNPLSQQDLRQYIESTTGDIYRDGQLRLIIESNSEAVLQQSGLTAKRSYSPKDGLTIGCIDLFDFDPRNRKAAIGMYVAPEYRGRGVGKEAVRALEQYAFDHLRLRLLYAVIADRNTACLSLYRSLGYEEIASLPDWTLEGDATLFLRRAGE